MRFRLQLITIQDNGQEQVQELAELARREELQPETTGLTLAESQTDYADSPASRR